MHIAPECQTHSTVARVRTQVDQWLHFGETNVCSHSQSIVFGTQRFSVQITTVGGLTLMSDNTPYVL